MVHIAIGTKVQFIKMAPIMVALKKRGTDFNLINLGQHAKITRNLREEFELKRPDVTLATGKNVARVGQDVRWISMLLMKGLRRSWVKEHVFRNRSGVCLIHGDTVSTPIALFLSKRAGLKVAHVEAGPRDVGIPVHPRIHDMGSLEYHQVPLFLSTLDVGIICNRASAFGTYFFPQKAREMMDCNVPLVAANVEGTRGLFSNHPEWLFTPEDPVDLAQVVKNRFKNNTTNYGSVSTWSDMAGHLEKIFLNLTVSRTE